MLDKKNKVFIATSLDGYIADQNGSIAWLDTLPEINNIDTGYDAFTEEIDALVMGRKTFETVCGFNIEWPYKKPVFVVSNTLAEIPEKYTQHVHLLNGTVENILKEIHSQNYNRLYIDGGGLIQSFLKEDLIDEMIITVIPVLLGAGIPLFSDLPHRLNFKCISSKIFLKAVVQNHFVRAKT